MGDYITDQSYDFYSLFTMPDDDGGTRALAVPRRTGTYVVALYGMIVTFILTTFWMLFVNFALMLPFPNTRKQKERARQREVVNVVVWNTTSTWCASYLMLYFAITRFISRKAAQTRDWVVIFYGVLFMFLALFIGGGGILGGTLLSTRLNIGTVAPVASGKDILFYPDLDVIDFSDYVEIARMNTALRPAAVRAFGSVDAARLTWGSEVAIQYAMDDGIGGENRNFFLNYSYAVSGIDLGLQQGSDIRMSVSGSCETRYDWILPPTNGSDVDEYLLWPTGIIGTYSGYTVSKNPNRTNLSPTVGFVLYTPDNATESITSGARNMSFAIVVGSAHRSSVTNSTNPWYETEPNPAYDGDIGPDITNTEYRVKDRRPPLVCTELESWWYKGIPSRLSVLSDMPGVTVPRVLIDVLRNGFSAPMIYNLGLIYRESAIISTLTTVSRGVVDAESTPINVDMETLIWAAYVATRNFLKDTILDPGQIASYRMPNVFMDQETNTLREGSSAFVIASRDVMTLSFRVLVILPCILVGLWILQLGLIALENYFVGEIRNGNWKNEGGWWNKYIGRLHLLTNTQLYRYIQKTKTPHKYQEQRASTQSLNKHRPFESEPHVMAEVVSLTSDEERDSPKNA